MTTKKKTKARPAEPRTEIKDLKLVTQATDFFKQEVTKALQHQKITIDQNTEFYLVDMLTRFMFSENLFGPSENGGKKEEVLTLLMLDALSAADLRHKQLGLRRLGDVSLYMAGFFSDRLSRKVVDVDYYIGMGRTAYSSLAATGFDLYFHKVFIELSEQFHKFVDVLGEISEATGNKDSTNILRIYDVWLKTRSERAEKSLKEAGIIPNSLMTLKPGWQ